MALSGFSKWSWFGPRPSLIKALESGTVFVCQPLSAWNFSIAFCDAWSQTPVAFPSRKRFLIRASWTWRPRLESLFCCPRRQLAFLDRFPRWNVVGFLDALEADEAELL